MNFSIEREKLLKPLQQVVGVVERRQTLPVLSNVLMVVDGDTLALTGTDLEVELVARIGLRADRLILGYMVATAFISMWVSNTATTAMMLPIALGILSALHRVRVANGEASGPMDARAWHGGCSEAASSLYVASSRTLARLSENSASAGAVPRWVSATV